MPVCSCSLIHRQTDWQTDGRTDGCRIARTAPMRSCDKNWSYRPITLYPTVLVRGTIRSPWYRAQMSTCKECRNRSDHSVQFSLVQFNLFNRLSETQRKSQWKASLKRWVLSSARSRLMEGERRWSAEAAVSSRQLGLRWRSSAFRASCSGSWNEQIAALGRSSIYEVRLRTYRSG